MACPLPVDGAAVPHIDLARGIIRRRWPERPRAAVILGTGLGGMVDQIQCDVVIPFDDLPGFPQTTAVGHRGRVVCGRLRGVPLLVLDGRCHLYEGYSVSEITFPVRVVSACGASLLIISNASGGLNPEYAKGDVMAIEDHLLLAGRRVVPAGGTTACGRSVRAGSSPYDERLTRTAIDVARQLGVVMHRGVYVAVTGPNYETRAEYRFLRRIGGDVVGMSTVPEAMVARELGLRVLGLSVVTNVASPEVPQTVSAAAVLDVAAHTEPLVRQVVAEVVATSVTAS
jgi:purine-nucleoside phosphorylase